MKIIIKTKDNIEIEKMVKLVSLVADKGILNEDDDISIQAGDCSFLYHKENDDFIFTFYNVFDGGING